MSYRRQYDEIGPGSQKSVNDGPYTESFADDDSFTGQCKRFFCKNVRLCSCCCCLYILLFLILVCWIAFMIIYFGYIQHLSQPVFKAAYINLNPNFNVTNNPNDANNPLIIANCTIIVETENKFTMDMDFSDMRYKMYGTDWNNNLVKYFMIHNKLFFHTFTFSLVFWCLSFGVCLLVFVFCFVVVVFFFFFAGCFRLSNHFFPFLCFLISFFFFLGYFASLLHI